MSTMNSNTRIAATQCSLGTWFVSGIYVWIPCIQEISMMMMLMVIIIIIIIMTNIRNRGEGFLERYLYVYVPCIQWPMDAFRHHKE